MDVDVDMDSDYDLGYEDTGSDEEMQVELEEDYRTPSSRFTVRSIYPCNAAIYLDHTFCSVPDTQQRRRSARDHQDV